MSVDLDVLRRSGPEPAAPSRRRGGFFVGVVLLAGALVWGFLLARPWIFPPRRVETAVVRVDTVAARRGAVVEATGWMEAEPYAVRVRPLVEGFVKSLEVREHYPVKAGETVVARLENPRIEEDLERAERTLLAKEKAVESARAEADRARGLLEQKADLRREVARLEGEAALATAEIAASRAEVSEAQRAVLAAEAELGAQRQLFEAGKVGSVPLAKADAAHEGARAAVERRLAGVARAEAMLVRAQVELVVAKEVLADPVDLASMAAVAAARVAQAEADAAESRTARDIAKRYVDRLTVRAPVDGIVLRLESAPGSVVGPLSMSRGGADAPGSSGGGEGSLVALYDPKRLQARIDVLLSSAGGVGVGQQAELFLEALPGRTFHGEVTRVVSEADPLKNTLQAKVRVLDPDPLMRPEMVVRARFLAPKVDAVAAGGEVATTARLLVPRRALRDGAVFVVDPRRGGRSRRIAVTKVAEEGDFVEVTGDLSATHRVILDAVDDGERIVAEGGAP